MSADAMIAHRYGTIGSYNLLGDRIADEMFATDDLHQFDDEEDYGAFWHGKAKRAEIQRKKAEKAERRGNEERAARLRFNADRLDAGMSKREVKALAKRGEDIFGGIQRADLFGAFFHKKAVRADIKQKKLQDRRERGLKQSKKSKRLRKEFKELSGETLRERKAARIAGGLAGGAYGLLRMEDLFDGEDEGYREDEYPQPMDQPAFGLLQRTDLFGSVEKFDAGNHAANDFKGWAESHLYPVTNFHLWLHSKGNTWMGWGAGMPVDYMVFVNGLNSMTAINAARDAAREIARAYGTKLKFTSGSEDGEYVFAFAEGGKRRDLDLYGADDDDELDLEAEAAGGGGAFKFMKAPWVLPAAGGLAAGVGLTALGFHLFGRKKKRSAAAFAGVDPRQIDARQNDLRGEGYGGPVSAPRKSRGQQLAEASIPGIAGGLARSDGSVSAPRKSRGQQLAEASIPGIAGGLARSDGSVSAPRYGVLSGGYSAGGFDGLGESVAHAMFENDW